jgi:hypothetical protein
VVSRFVASPDRVALILDCKKPAGRPAGFLLSVSHGPKVIIERADPNAAIVSCVLVIPAKAGIQLFFDLSAGVPGSRLAPG